MSGNESIQELWKEELKNFQNGTTGEENSNLIRMSDLVSCGKDFLLGFNQSRSQTPHTLQEGRSGKNKAIFLTRDVSFLDFRN